MGRTLALVVLCLVACKGSGKSRGPAPSAATTAAPQHLSCGLCPSFGSTCAPGELAPYNACIDKKCDAEQTSCYGADYKTGVPGGPCSEWIKCEAACRCDDAPCLRKCTATKACNDCLSTTLHPCFVHAGCFLPACADQGMP